VFAQTKITENFVAVREISSRVYTVFFAFWIKRRTLLVSLAARVRKEYGRKKLKRKEKKICLVFMILHVLTFIFCFCGQSKKL